MSSIQATVLQCNVLCTKMAARTTPVDVDTKRLVRTRAPTNEKDRDLPKQRILKGLRRFLSLRPAAKAIATLEVPGNQTVTSVENSRTEPNHGRPKRHI